MVDVTNSATEGSVDLTVSCMVTPSDNASLARTKICSPPLNKPKKNQKNSFLRRVD